MKKLWISVLALLLVTPLFALNSEEKPTRQEALDRGLQLFSQELGEFPVETLEEYVENARNFLTNPNFMPNEIAAAMLDLWLIEKCGDRENSALRQLMLRDIIREPGMVLRDGMEEKAERKITKRAKWYHDAVSMIPQEATEEEAREMKRDAILKKMDELETPAFTELGQVVGRATP